MSRRFDYVKLDSEHEELLLSFKSKFIEIEALAENHLTAFRYKAILLTDLERAYMAVGKAVRDMQINKNGHVKDEPSRGDI